MGLHSYTKIFAFPLTILVGIPLFERPFCCSTSLSVKFCRLKVTKFLKTSVTFNRQNFLNDKIDKRRIFFTVEIFHQILIFYSKCLFLFFTSLEHLELYLQSKKGTMGGIFCKKVRNSVDSN